MYAENVMLERAIRPAKVSFWWDDKPIPTENEFKIKYYMVNDCNIKKIYPVSSTSSLLLSPFLGVPLLFLSTYPFKGSQPQQRKQSSVPYLNRPQLTFFSLLWLFPSESACFQCERVILSSLLIRLFGPFSNSLHSSPNIPWSSLHYCLCSPCSTSSRLLLLIPLSFSF